MVERSIPEVERLAAAGQYFAAFTLAQRAERAAPGDPRVKRALLDTTFPVTITEPAGADVYFKDYADVDGEWQPLGRAPLKEARAPIGQLRWRMTRTGFDASEGSSAIGPLMALRPAGETPAGMVLVRGVRHPWEWKPDPSGARHRWLCRPRPGSR